MRAVVRVFLTFPTKSIGGSLTYKELPVKKLFIFVQRSFFQNLRLLGFEIGSYGLLEKKTRRPRLASGIEHLPECKNKERR